MSCEERGMMWKPRKWDRRTDMGRGSEIWNLRFQDGFLILLLDLDQGRIENEGSGPQTARWESQDPRWTPTHSGRLKLLPWYIPRYLFILFSLINRCDSSHSIFLVSIFWFLFLVLDSTFSVLLIRFPWSFLFVSPASPRFFLFLFFILRVSLGSKFASSSFGFSSFHLFFLVFVSSLIRFEFQKVVCVSVLVWIRYQGGIR